VTMTCSPHSAASIRILSAALSGAFSEFDESRRSARPNREKAELRRKLTQSLLEAFEAGERDPEALKRAGLAAIECPSLSGCTF
jgi:hypothetical protein